jgi:D-tyrosyl-tRNA(Tyr) deacylase
MRILLQHVSRASVAVDHKVIGQIERGYVLLVGVGHDDDQKHADRLAEKIIHLRLFPDEQGRFDRSLLEIEGSALVVSQFTLYGNVKKGRRPSFTDAAAPELAEPLCNYLADRLRQLGVKHVATGRFGAMMDVEIHNAGPVTLWLDSANL